MEPRSLVAAIDQGTTSSRCILFDRSGRPVASHQLEHAQITPRPGWVEHDADEILERVRTCVRVALRDAGADAGALAAVGISDQRETTVVWDRAGPGARSTTRSSGRTPGRPSAGERLAAGGAGRHGPLPGADRAADLDLFVGPQARLDPRGRAAPSGAPRPRPATSCSGPIDTLADLAADRRRRRRRPRHRRHERLADDADGPRVAGLGARAARRGRRPGGDAARDPLARPRSTATGSGTSPASRSRATSATSRRRCSARPASSRASSSAPTARAASCSCTPGERPVHSRHGLITTVAARLGDAPGDVRARGLGRGRRAR